MMVNIIYLYIKVAELRKLFQLEKKQKLITELNK